MSLSPREPFTPSLPRVGVCCRPRRSCGEMQLGGNRSTLALRTVLLPYAFTDGHDRFNDTRLRVAVNAAQRDG